MCENTRTVHQRFLIYNVRETVNHQFFYLLLMYYRFYLFRGQTPDELAAARDLPFVGGKLTIKYY